MKVLYIFCTSLFVDIRFHFEEQISKLGIVLYYEKLKHFPKWMDHFIIPQAMYGSHTPWPTFGLFSLLNFSYSSGSIVVFIVVLLLHFPGNWARVLWRNCSSYLPTFYYLYLLLSRTPLSFANTFNRLYFYKSFWFTEKLRIWYRVPIYSLTQFPLLVTSYTSIVHLL